MADIARQYGSGGAACNGTSRMAMRRGDRMCGRIARAAIIELRLNYRPGMATRRRLPLGISLTRSHRTAFAIRCQLDSGGRAVPRRNAQMLKENPPQKVQKPVASFRIVSSTGTSSSSNSAGRETSSTKSRSV